MIRCYYNSWLNQQQQSIFITIPGPAGNNNQMLLQQLGELATMISCYYNHWASRQQQTNVITTAG